MAVEVRSNQASGWPYSTYPTGWFQVGWEAEYEPGSVHPMKYFGCDLVLFRAEDGTTTVADAFCPHQGAHLGHGGWVEGDCLVCPYHGWQWDGDGRNRLVPTDGGPTDRRRLRTWPVRVTNGIVWVWYDARSREPDWEPPADVPEYGDEVGFYPVYPHCVKKFEDVDGKPQYMTENNADIEHLRWVHRADGPLGLDYQEPDGPLMRSRVSMVLGYGKERTRLTPNGPIEGKLTSVTYGIGAIVVRFDLDGAVLLSCGTAVDEDHFDIFQTVITPRPEGSTGDEPDGIAAARLREQFVQVTRDFEIWANMRYEAQPPYARAEAKVMAAFRRWCAQFYPDAAAEVPVGVVANAERAS